MKKPQTAPDPRRAQKLQAFDRLLTIMDELRENCPWDKKQTFESLRHLTIEETYELGDAILSGDRAEIRKELGDITLHIAFYARLGQEEQAFDMADVLDGICDKLIARHPHIYGDVQAEDEEAVKRNWEALKLKEGHRSVLAGVPQSLPALVKAMRIQEKVRGVGFDWDHAEQVWDKVQEESQELRTEVQAENPVPERISEEFGDLLFALVNYSRFINVNPEEALERTNRKFIARFQYMEEQITQAGLSMHDMDLAQLDTWWNQAKAVERQGKE